MIHQTDFDLSLISLTFMCTGSALGPALGQCIWDNRSDSRLGSFVDYSIYIYSIYLFSSIAIFLNNKNIRYAIIYFLVEFQTQVHYRPSIFILSLFKHQNQSYSWYDSLIFQIFNFY